MEIPSDTISRALNHLPASSEKWPSARELFSSGAEHFERAEMHEATHDLEAALYLAESQDCEEIAPHAATSLALVRLSLGMLEEALSWFIFVQYLPKTHTEGIAVDQIQMMVVLLRALINSQKLNRRLIKFQSTLRGKVVDLEEEVSSLSNHIRIAMREGMNASFLPTMTVCGSEIQKGEEQVEIRVRLLGSFSASFYDCTSVVLSPHRKSQALFKLLVAAPNARFHKEHLLSLFWRNEDPSSAINKLHTAVSRLRGSLAGSGLGDDALLFEDDFYFLNHRIQIDSDLQNFQTHIVTGLDMEAIGEVELAITEYEFAVALYRGEYLAELVGDDWFLPQRAQIEQEFIELLCQLTACYCTCARYVKAEACCRQLLRHDNLREDIYRRLMRCLSFQGKRNQALRVYQELHNLLKKELGVEPMQQTKSLVECIKEEESID